MPRISQPELLLAEALSELEGDWKIARAEWRDQARESFEEDFLEALRPALRVAVDSLVDLTLLMKRVVHECT